MLQYIMIAIAGIAAGIVGLRVWQTLQTTKNEEPQESEAADADGLADTTAPGRVAGMLVALRRNALLATAGVILIAASGVYLLRGREVDPAAQSLAAAADVAGLDDVDTMITRLAERLEANPEDGEGFRMLGWSYLMVGKPELAVAPYKRALELMPDNSQVHAGHGEVLAALAGNTVTPEARAAFQRAVVLDSREPRARYFLALWDAQNGRSQEALDAWIALAKEGPADATWQTELRSEIARVSAELGVDVDDRLPPVAAAEAAGQPPALDPTTMAAANQLPEGQRQEMISGMVEGLAARLQSNPGDMDGWIRLLRSRMVLKQRDIAAREYAHARTALAGDPAGLAQLRTAAAEFGVPGA